MPVAISTDFQNVPQAHFTRHSRTSREAHHFAQQNITATRKRCLHGDVKVSTGTAKLGKRVAVRRRFKSLNFKTNDNNKVALAA